MKKHPFIEFEFHSSVKLTDSETKKLNKWLKMGTQALEQLLEGHKIIHPQWRKEAGVFKVSVLLCGESKIKKINHEYRDKNKVTDVLSFPSFSTLRKAPLKGELLGPELFLGDLVICHQRALKQAKEFDITYWDEFIHLFMHGMLHLMGYDHEISVKEQKVMEEWEDLALKQFSLIKKKGP